MTVYNKIPEPEWLLTGDPRPAQLEAMRRSMLGYDLYDHKDAEANFRERATWNQGPAPGFAFFMQMRVGKTPTWLNQFMLLKRDAGIRKGIMFAPNKFKDTWPVESERFGVDVEMRVHRTDKKLLKKNLEDFTKKREGIVVVNYEALIQTDVVQLLGEFVGTDTLIGFDESVKTKNPNGTFFKRSLDLVKEVHFSSILTGKPAPQSPLDYYAQLRLIRGLNGVNPYQFRARHCKMGGYKGKKVLGVRNPEGLAATVAHHGFMAERKDWAEYIESQYITRRVEMSKEQLRAYSEMEKDFIVWLDDNTKVSVEMAAHKHMKLQQISSGFIYDEHGESRPLLPFEATDKAKDLLEYLEEEAVSKVIIAYVHKPVGEALLTLLAEYNPAIIAGDQLMKRMSRDVEAEKRRFNLDPDCRVMIAQETAVKYGHTLMGTETDPCLDLIFYENSYSLDDRAQTEERPQGNGQVAALNIVDYASSPVELKVVKALQQKESVSQVVVDHYKSR